MLFRLLAVPSGVGNGFVFVRPRRQQRTSLEFVRHNGTHVYRGVDHDVFSRKSYRFSDPLGPRPRFPFLPAKPRCALLAEMMKCED